MKKVTGHIGLRSLLLAAAILAAVFFGSGRSAQAASAAKTPAAPDCSIVYDFGSGRTYTVTPALAMSMMTTNADGSYAIDPKTGYYYLDATKMLGFFSGLQAMFPASGSVSSAGFVTTAGTVLPGYNASSFQQTKAIDTTAEISYLSTAIMQRKKEHHVPAYRSGGTYIEVDKTNQILYYYENGVLISTTPIVTGNESKGWSTPSGIYSVRYKTTDTYLSGANYSSFVHYWMAFIGNSYGIHDANWRSTFGGQIYLTNGSHGCVNVPPANMPALYQAVKVGTPVVIY